MGDIQIKLTLKKSGDGTLVTIFPQTAKGLLKKCKEGQATSELLNTTVISRIYRLFIVLGK